MGARLLAALVATALVVGAVVVRTNVLDDDGGKSGTGRASGNGGGAAVMLCARDIAATCGAVEPDEQTYEELIELPRAADADLSVWVTAGPGPLTVDAKRRSEGLPVLFGEHNILASTQLVAVVRKRPPGCPEKVTWRCLGDAAQLQTGQPVLAAPAKSTGVRLLVTAAFAGAFLDKTDFSSDELELTSGALDWVLNVDRGIEGGRDRGAKSLPEFVALPAADVFLTTAADAASLPGGRFETVVPTPIVRVHAVAGFVAVGDPPRRLTLPKVTDALLAAGWTKPTTGPTGLPSPGVLVALREIV